MSAPTDPLVDALCDAERELVEALECSSDDAEWKATDEVLKAAKARLSAVLAAAREVVRQDDESIEPCNVDMHLLRDALTAADGAR